MSDKVLRNFQILKTIATGGTAVLYKAIQTSLDRPVVIKRLHSHLTSDANFTRRFELEAKAAASLDHENIVRIIDFGVSSNNYYIVMEYIDGRTLKELLERTGPLGEELAFLVAHEICMGLDHAHQRGIIHRDIKPANIMVTCEGQVKITDFGLVKLHQSQVQQTIANTLLGTPLYMSPEQAIGESIDGRSDLFSLGTVCYEIMTGTQPFIGNNYAAVIQNIVNCEVPTPSRIGAKISTVAESIVMKSLNREPGKRYRTALEMAGAIESHLGEQRISSMRTRLKRLAAGEEVGPVKVNSGPRRRRGRWRIILPAAAAVVAALAIAFHTSLFEVVSELGSRVADTADPVEPREEYTAARNEMAAGVSFSPLEGMPALPAYPIADSTASVTGTADSLTAAAPTDSSPPAATGTGDGTETPPPPPPDSLTEEAAAEPAPPKAVTGFLDIMVEPGASIMVDGREEVVGTRCGPAEVPVGRHEISCKKAGYREYRETINVKRGEMSLRRIILQRVTGGVYFETEKHVQVFVNGIYKTTTPLPDPIELPSGTYRIELKKPGYKKWSSEVYVPPDETLWLKIDLSPL